VQVHVSSQAASPTIVNTTEHQDKVVCEAVSCLGCAAEENKSHVGRIVVGDGSMGGEGTPGDP
jgi:hypothetical protein